MTETIQSFAQSKVADLFDSPGADLISITKETTIAGCLDILRNNKILSVPVIENGKILGVVDIYEIVSYTAFKTQDDSEFLEAIDWSIPAYHLLATTGNYVDDEVKGYYEANSDEPIQMMLEFLSKGAYRFIVNFPDRRTIFSQRDLIRVFHNKFDLFVDKNVTVAQTEISHAPVFALKQTEIALHGLRKIRLKEIHAIAIVHEDTGKLVGCLSESDLRQLTVETLPTLLDSIQDFLGLTPNRNNVFVILEEHTLYFVMEMMIAKKLHRVYVVNHDYKPIKVVTLTDILLYFWNKLFEVFYTSEPGTEADAK